MADLDTTLPANAKERLVTPHRQFLIAALRRHVAALEGVEESSLPPEFRFARDGVEVVVTPDSWIICDAPEASS